jgi:hypothetical protein
MHGRRNSRWLREAAAAAGVAIACAAAAAHAAEDDRDALIEELQRRVEVLERKLSELAEERELEEVRAQVTAAEPPAATPGRPAPAQLEVDEEAAERALERALVTTGALLVPPWQAEIEPSFSYLRSERAAPLFLTEDATQELASLQIRRNIFTAQLRLRLGLPFDSQLEIGIPYRYVEQEDVRDVAFAPRARTRGHGSGAGDLRVGLAKSLLRERGWVPDLIGRLTWDTDTGRVRDDGIALGGFGFHELEGSLIAIKRQDPLVFLAGVSYTRAYEKDAIRPGDAVGLSLGVLLAASPETSLRAVLQQSFVDEFEVNGAAVAGSRQTIGALALGASSIIGRGRFLDVTAGVGLTEDAADYSLGISYSVRFAPFRR